MNVEGSHVFATSG